MESWRSIGWSAVPTHSHIAKSRGVIIRATPPRKVVGTSWSGGKGALLTQVPKSPHLGASDGLSATPRASFYGCYPLSGLELLQLGGVRRGGQRALPWWRLDGIVGSDLAHLQREV